MKTRYLLFLLFLLMSVLSKAQSGKVFYDNALEYSKMGNNQFALLEINKAITYNPDNIEYLITKGRICYFQKDFQEAYNSFSHVIELDPSSPFGYVNRANVLMSANEFEPAMADINAAISLQKNDTLLHQLIATRGTAYFLKMDYEHAYEDMMSAYKFDSMNTTTIIGLSNVVGRMGKNEDALKLLLRADALEPGDVAILGNIGFQFQKLGDYKSSVKYYDKALAINPAEALGYSNRAYSKLMVGDVKEALIDVNKSIELSPENSYAYRNRALIYLKKKERDKACIDLSLALEKGFTTNYGDEVEELKKKHCKD